MDIWLRCLGLGLGIIIEGDRWMVRKCLAGLCEGLGLVGYRMMVMLGDWMMEEGMGLGSARLGGAFWMVEMM